MKHFFAFVSGALFALGLAVSGMTQPDKIRGFLDFFGDWDPALALVLGTALLVYVPAVLVARRLSTTVIGFSFIWPEQEKFNLRFYLGAAIFGIGWGLGGLCPGPAIVALGGLSGDAWLFFVVMVASIMATDRWLSGR